MFSPPIIRTVIRSVEQEHVILATLGPATLKAPRQDDFSMWKESNTLEMAWAGSQSRYLPLPTAHLKDLHSSV